MGLNLSKKLLKESCQSKINFHQKRDAFVVSLFKKQNRVPFLFANLEIYIVYYIIRE